MVGDYIEFEPVGYGEFEIKKVKEQIYAGKIFLLL